MEDDPTTEAIATLENRLAELIAAVKKIQENQTQTYELLVCVMRLSYTGAAGTIKSLSEMRSLIGAAGIDVGSWNSLIEKIGDSLQDLQKYLSASRHEGR